MKIGKVPMGSLLGRLPLPGKKKGEIAPSGSSTPEPSQGNSGKKKKRRKLKLWMKIIIVLLLVAAVLAVVMFQRSRAAAQAAATASSVNTATVERRDVTSELSSTGTLEAADSYSIVSLVEGDVISADFEEGDQVEAGQILYQIDSSSVLTQLTSAQNSLTRAQESYDDAVADYNKALSDYSGNTYKATESGYISELNIHVGDRISGSATLAQLYSDDVMKIRVPFLSGEAALIAPGMAAVLTLVDTREQVAGTVTAVASQETALTGGRLVKYVTMEVANPGGLTITTQATAQIGDFIGSDEGTFAAVIDKAMNANLSATVEVAAVLVEEGAYVTNGTPIFLMTDETAEDLIDSYQDSMDNAESQLESAQTSLDNTQEEYDNYTITAPISGQVITKNYKVGDTIERNTSSSTTVATIYDLSELTFEMSIDELDVLNVEVGQTVEVTADALEGQTFTGTVTNVSLESSYSNGVTTYPVTVTMNEMGDLLPGMNVDGVIILDEAEDVLAVPSGALMRGNQVYVQDTSVTEAQGPVPAGFRAVQVETGVISDSYVEITSGLEEGDVVYVADTTSTTTGFMMMGPGGMGGGPGGRGGMGGGPGGGGGGRR